MWILIAALGFLCYAVVAVMDKMILTRSVKHPLMYVFYSTIVSLGAVAAYPFGVTPLLGGDWLWAGFAAGMFGVGLWALFTAIAQSEISHVGPFAGALVTAQLFVLSAFVLGERLSGTATAGVAFLAAASLVLSFERSREHNGVHRGFAWAALASICMALSQMASKYLYLRYPFLTVLVWVSLAIGMFGVLCLLSPDVRRALRTRERSKGAYSLIVANKALAFAAVVLVQYAMARGSVTIVSALGGLQFVFLFVIVLCCTRYAPRLFREEITHQEIIAQSIALLLVAAGLIFLAV